MLTKWMLTGSAFLLLTACGTPSVSENIGSLNQPSNQEGNTLYNESSIVEFSNTTANANPTNDVNQNMETISVEKPNTTSVPNQKKESNVVEPQNTAKKTDATSIEKQDPVKPVNHTPSHQPNATNVDITNPAVSWTEAVKIFNESYPNAKIESIELDIEYGRLNYDIEGFDGTKEYEVEIDATTKELRVNKIENERDMNEAIDISSIISPSKAIEIASSRSEVGGISPISWNLDADHGRQIYTIEYKKNYTEIEIEINATTGEILEVEIDD